MYATKQVAISVHNYSALTTRQLAAGHVEESLPPVVITKSPQGCRKCSDPTSKVRKMYTLVESTDR